MKSKKNYYFDHAAATPLDNGVKKILIKSFAHFGNPSSIHSIGRKSRNIFENNRMIIAKMFGVKTSEIIITGSGTESNNLAIIGFFRAYKKYGNHIIVASTEHHSVLNVCRYLEKYEGAVISYLPVKSNGQIDPKILEKELLPTTILVSIHYVNNEIGTIQDLRALAKVIRSFKKENSSILPVFHTDACQAPGILSCRPQDILVDSMTINSSKIYGPKGIALLYKKDGYMMKPIMYGGDQEKGLRPGTENAVLLSAFTYALKKTVSLVSKETAHLTYLRKYFIEQLSKNIKDFKINGDIIIQSPHIINIAFKNINSEQLVLALNEHCIQVSAGAACTSFETGPSHVIRALNVSEIYENGSLRISFGRDTKKTDIEFLVLNIIKEIKRLQRN